MTADGGRPLPRHDLFLAIEDFPVENIPPEALKRCIDGVRKGREPVGFADTLDGRPLLCFFSSARVGKKENVPLYPYSWELELGASVTVTAFLPAQGARVLFASTNEILPLLAGGRLIALFVGPGGPWCAKSVDLANQPETLACLRGVLNACASHKPKFGCAEAHAFEMLEQASRMWSKLEYTRDQRCGIGWIPFFRFHALDKVKYLGHLASVDGSLIPSRSDG